MVLVDCLVRAGEPEQGAGVASSRTAPLGPALDTGENRTDPHGSHERVLPDVLSRACHERARVGPVDSPRSLRSRRGGLDRLLDRVGGEPPPRVLASRNPRAGHVAPDRPHVLPYLAGRFRSGLPRAVEDLWRTGCRTGNRSERLLPVDPSGGTGTGILRGVPGASAEPERTKGELPRPGVQYGGPERKGDLGSADAAGGAGRDRLPGHSAGQTRAPGTGLFGLRGCRCVAAGFRGDRRRDPGRAAQRERGVAGLSARELQTFADRRGAGGSMGDCARRTIPLRHEASVRVSPRPAEGRLPSDPSADAADVTADPGAAWPRPSRTPSPDPS